MTNHATAMEAIAQQEQLDCFALTLPSTGRIPGYPPDPFARERLGSAYTSIRQELIRRREEISPRSGLRDDQLLPRIVSRWIAPLVLSRRAYMEDSLRRSLLTDDRQFLSFAAGFSTFAYRNRKFCAAHPVFELDSAALLDEKSCRLARFVPECPLVHPVACNFTQPGWEDSLLRAGFQTDRPSFAALPGICRFLSAESWRFLLLQLSNLLCSGSTVVFDYLTTDTAENLLGEPPAAKNPFIPANQLRYSYRETEQLLSECGFRIYEHLAAHRINHQYFSHFPILQVEEEVAFCLAVRK